MSFLIAATILELKNQHYHFGTTLPTRTISFTLVIVTSKAT